MSAPDKLFAKGNQVIIHCGDNHVAALIALASENGRSLILTFEAILDGHVGMMPVLQDDFGRYASIVTGTEVRIERAPA